MADAFQGNLNMFAAYAGRGFLWLLYAAAFVYLFVREKTKWKRIFLLYVPAVILFVCFLPPVRMLYTLVLGEADTYYRILWLVPFGVTICYAGVSAFAKQRRAGLVVCAVLIALAGRNVYREEIITRADNPWQLNGTTVLVCETILQDMPADWDAVIACLPEAMVQQARQYTSKIWLTFGRDVVHWQYQYNDSYNALKENPADAEAIDAAMRKAYGVYLVLHETKELKGDLAAYGWEKRTNVNGFDIWRRKDAVE